MKIKFLSVKRTILSMVLLANVSFSGGIPTFDIASVTEAILSNSNQIKEYTLQLEQYKAQITNLTEIPMQLWNDINGLINSIQDLTNMQNQLKSIFGGDMNTLLDALKLDVMGSNCALGYCNGVQLSSYQKKERLLKQLESELYNSILQGASEQQNMIKKDADHISELQKNAQKAVGALGAQQASNQINSTMNNQLLQMRQMDSAKMQAEALKEQRRLKEETLLENHRRQYSTPTPIYGGASGGIKVFD